MAGWRTRKRPGAGAAILVATGFIASVSLMVLPLRTARAGIEKSSAKTYVLAVGINKYPKESGLEQIEYAEADASQLAPALAKREETQGLSSSSRVTTLLGSDATVANILSSMEKIAGEAGPDDHFYFVFDGMGICIPTERTYEFAAYDTQTLDQQTFRNGLSTKDLRTMLMQIPATFQYVVFDTCGSHKALNDLASALQLPGQKSLKVVRLVAPDGSSLETKEAGHGLLTSVLLEGLAGAADADHSGRITWDRLMGYLTWRLQEKTDFQEGIFSQTIYADVAPEPAPTRGSPSDSAPTRALTPDNSSEDEPADSGGLGEDYALLIGTDHYSGGWPVLHNAIGDVQAVHRELVRDYGYKDDSEHIIELDDATKHQTEHALETLLARKFDKRDRLLVYVASHGLKTPLEGYVVFADSRTPKPGDAEDNATDSMMAFSYLSDALDQMKVRHELLVLDVCYGGRLDAKTPFHSLMGTTGDDTAPRDELIRRALEASSRIYITSGDENHQVSDGDPGQHSPFSRRFLAILQQNRSNPVFLDVSTLYYGLRSLPREPRAGYFYQSHAEEGADFILIPRPEAPARTQGR
jgi:uncharacterized caspase-like protein